MPRAGCPWDACGHRNQEEALWQRGRKPRELLLRVMLALGGRNKRELL